MAYSLCDGNPAIFCPASGLCHDIRLSMWEGLDAAEMVMGEDRQPAVEQSIAEDLRYRGRSVEVSDISRMAISLMHIVDGNCERDKITTIR